MKIIIMVKAISVKVIDNEREPVDCKNRPITASVVIIILFPCSRNEMFQKLSTVVFLSICRCAQTNVAFISRHFHIFDLCVAEYADDMQQYTYGGVGYCYCPGKTKRGKISSRKQIQKITKIQNLRFARNVRESHSKNCTVDVKHVEMANILILV